MSTSSELELFGRVTSSNVQKVLWCCDELGITYKRYDIGREFGGNREPDYLAMNPNGLVPTIRHGDLVVWESNAILRYLAGSFDGQHLYPAGIKQRAKVDQWLDWEATTLAPGIFPVFWGLIRTPPEKRDEKAIAAATELLVGHWSILDRQLESRPFVAGEQLSLADIAMGNSIHRWFAFPIERPPMAALRSWYDRLLQRTGYANHIAKPVM